MIPDNDDFYSEPRSVGEGAENAEHVAKAMLHPKTLMDFIGQNTIKTQLNLVLRATKERRSAMDHMLLAGPPGLGKTTLAMIIAAETSSFSRLTSGPATSHARDLAAILSLLQEGDILFIDKVRRLARPAREMLYLTMEGFRVGVVVGKGPEATSIPLSLSQFTLVGATTRVGLLPASLRDWFGFTACMEPYEARDLSLIVKRSATLLEACITGEAAREIAKRSRGAPRVANRLLRRVMDFALVHDNGKYDLEATQATLELFEVNGMGFDRLDQDVLHTIVERFQGSPVRAGTLAVSVGEEEETVGEVVEPFLVQASLLARVQRGRVITVKGYTHLGSPVPGGVYTENALFPSP